MTLYGLLSLKERAQKVLVNPWSFLARRRGPVIFKSGAVVWTDGTRRRWDMANALVTLAYHGVPLQRHKDQVHGVGWAVTFDLMNDAKGIEMRLASINPTIFLETFVYQTHWLGEDLTGSVVVDIGAYTGDTALYYAQRGALVMSFEPDPDHFSKLEQNLANSRSDISRRIFPERKAIVGDDRTSSTLFQKASREGEGDGHVVSTGSPEVLSGTATIVPTRGILDVALSARGLANGQLGVGGRAYLKCDAKGEEISIVARTEAMRLFDGALIEYVNGRETLPLLLQCLERAGFRCSIFKHNSAPFSLADHGTIRASRVEEPAG
ncbi:MAG: FkbM family methyltransferase [Euryarchaeota archaeon]|nr:FkbM family methyltransferase [Euryarchaeota archaeon]MDE1882182.1 FkbM family methyltransferase [Euryarchaeota archaeon]